MDELVNTDTTVLLERFLYMRPELICNSFVNSIRSLHDDVRALARLTRRSPPSR